MSHCGRVTLKLVLKNITITVSEETAHWVCRKAAEENTSVSPLVGQIRLIDRQAYGAWQKIGGLPGMAPAASAAKRHMSVIEKVFVDTNLCCILAIRGIAPNRLRRTTWLTAPKPAGGKQKRPRERGASMTGRPERIGYYASFFRRPIARPKITEPRRRMEVGSGTA
jgi:hypothetical protein